MPGIGCFYSLRRGRGRRVARFAIACCAVLAMGCQISAAVPPGGDVTLQVPGGIARLAVGECGLPGQVIITTRDGKSLRLDSHDHAIPAK